MIASEQVQRPARRRGWLLAIPLVVFAGIAVLLAIGLGRDPSKLPSALLDKPAPEFALPPLEGGDLPGFSTADLAGQITLVNVFASWCVPCRVEHPSIMALAQDEGLAVFGLNYKDKPKDAEAFLVALGNPYARIGSDITGRTAIDWGVYGVPETFILDETGTIRYKHVGPIQERDLKETILPVIRELQRK